MSFAACVSPGSLEPFSAFDEGAVSCAMIVCVLRRQANSSMAHGLQAKADRPILGMELGQTFWHGENTKRRTFQNHIVSFFFCPPPEIAACRKQQRRLFATEPFNGCLRSEGCHLGPNTLASTRLVVGPQYLPAMISQSSRTT
jgi:hypothetical protein